MKRFEKRDGSFKNRLEVIDNLVIELKDGVYSGYLERLDIKGIIVDEKIYEAYYKDSNAKKVFGRMVLENYSLGEYTHRIYSDSFKPLDFSNPNLCNFKNRLSQKEWLDIVVETLGYDSKQLLFWEKIFTLVRLIPYCEKSYHIMELGKEKIGKRFLQNLFNDDISNSVVSMTLPEFIKNKDGLTEENSFLITSDIKDPEMKMEFKESLFSDVNIDLENTSLFDSFSYLIPNWGMRDISKFSIKPNQKELPLNSFSKTLRRLRNIDLSDSIIPRINRLISIDSDNEIKAISKTISGLIKILHLGTIPNEQEFSAYLAIAMKSRYLLNQQMIITNKDKCEVKGLSPEKYMLIQQSFRTFTAHIENIPLHGDLRMIPNRMTSESRERVTYHALDALGFEKNKRIEPNQVNPKDISKAKRWIDTKNKNKDSQNYPIYFEVFFTSDYFIDSDSEFQDNLFGETILEYTYALNNNYTTEHCVVYSDNSIRYPYKKPAPSQIECSCGEKASLIDNHYFYDKNSIQVPSKEVKKQLLSLGVI